MNFQTGLATAFVIAALAVLNGCASSGMGGGDIVQKGKPAQPVLFSWQSRDGSIDGTMTATTPDSTFQGRFTQVTRQTVTESLAPMWDPWPMAWSDWPYEGWGVGGFDVVQFGTVYSGKVIANLKDPTGRAMRCRLQLAQPEMGMKGGGSGECQIAGSPAFNATF
ncbi:hypothetical protein QTI66_13790 [Variovorax sp. J22R133]|uniref:hypothetical protein n=1 Tax=Variovorax brevis TaxID=3053503 RepID=UPI0025789320|nr:hypothetical protein [Variovorax sp. J22R133]MDM0113225.1 hypothetical protein [Variovorax sp. J22R133]